MTSLHQFNYTYFTQEWFVHKTRIAANATRNQWRWHNKTKPDVPQWQKLESLWAVQAATCSMWNSNARRQTTMSYVDRSHSRHSLPTSRGHVTLLAASGNQHW